MPAEVRNPSWVRASAVKDVGSAYWAFINYSILFLPSVSTKAPLVSSALFRHLRRPDGCNQTAACLPVGVSAQGLQQNAAVSFGDRPGLGMPFIERQQGIPIDPPDSPHSHGGQVKGCPWGWNGLYL